MIEIKHRITEKVLFTVTGTLFGANLRGANLFRANLRGADLSGANLSGANLSGADLSGANLFEANLCRAILRGADLSKTNLRGANLSETNLRGANLHGTDLRGANLRGANLRGANLRRVLGDSHKIHTMQTPYWSVVICLDQNTMAIGCEQHSIDDWRKFKDAKIRLMNTEALEFWKTWKPFIFQYIDILKQE